MFNYQMKSPINGHFGQNIYWLVVLNNYLEK